MELEATYNEVYAPFFETETRYNVLYGGGGSGKSEFTAQRLLQRCLGQSGHQYAIIRKNASTLRNSVYQLCKNIVTKWDLFDEFRFYDGRLEIHCNGNKIIFLGCDDPEKLKSLAEIQEIWVEEITELEAEDFTQIDLRLRGESEERKKIFISFNPIDQDHWLYNRFFVQQQDDITRLKTTYLHNAFVGEDYAKMLNDLKQYDQLYYDIYALGEWGVIKPERPFADNFDRKKHVKRGLKYEEGYDLFQLWDFNVDNTLILAQNVYTDQGNLKIRLLKEYHKSGWDLQRICQEVRTDYPEATYKLNGDASGKAGSALTSGNQSAYDILKEEQNLSWHQFNISSVNPSHLNSRLLTNLILKTNYGPDDYLVEIDEEGCPNVIKDFERVYVDKRGSLDECKRKNPELSHFLDPCRYHFNSEHYERIREIGYSKLINQ